LGNLGIFARCGAFSRSSDQLVGGAKVAIKAIGEAISIACLVAFYHAVTTDRTTVTVAHCIATRSTAAIIIYARINYHILTHGGAVRSTTVKLIDGAYIVIVAVGWAAIQELGIARLTVF